MKEKAFWRRKQVKEHLGMSDASLTKLIASGALKERFFPGLRRAFFLRTEVEQLMPATRNLKEKKK
jgi:hypothetical protein